MNIEHQKYEHVKKEYAKISVALIREYIEVIYDMKEEKILRGRKQRKVLWKTWKKQRQKEN